MSDPARGAMAEISLPEDIGAEQATLGACMLSGSAMASIEQTLVPSDFFREAHRVVFGCMIRIYRQGRPVDLVTVASGLRKERMLEQVGGGEYLTALINEVPSSAHGIHYARIVREHAVARDAIDIGRDLQHEIAGVGGDPRETMRAAMERFRHLQERLEPTNAPVLVGERFDQNWEQIERRRQRSYEVSAQRFGIPQLDRITGGLEDAGFCIIKGDTNTGKSSLLRQIILSTCLELQGAENGVVVLFAMEETDWRWQRRSMGWLGEFDTACFDNVSTWDRHLAKRPDLADTVANAAVAYGQLPLMVVPGDQTIDSIEAACRHIACSRTIRLVGIDYLQRISKDEEEYRTEEAAWRAISRRITRLRDEIECPIIAPSQVTRTAEGPHITFGARAFQHDADLELEIHRHRGEDGHWEPQCDIECTKSREIRNWGKFASWTQFETGRWYAELEAPVT